MILKISFVLPVVFINNRGFPPPPEFEFPFINSNFSFISVLV
jgi:hypothetical protein